MATTNRNMSAEQRRAGAALSPLDRLLRQGRLKSGVLLVPGPASPGQFPNLLSTRRISANPQTDSIAGWQFTR